MSVHHSSRASASPPRLDYGNDEQVIKVGKKEYDLKTPEGREALRLDLQDGKLDGKSRDADFRGVTYDKESNAVFAGDTVYFLDNEEQAAAFIKDVADGKLDGHGGKPPSKEVTVGDRTYDLGTREGREAFAADWETGDNKIETNDGFEYNAETREITAGGGEVTYDLDDPKQRRLFELDVRDGNLDGKRTHQDLREFDFGGGRHDLSSRYGRDRFQEDLIEGRLQVNSSEGYEYDPATNKMTIGDGKKTYDLNDPADRAAFRADLRDGDLDGTVTPRDAKHFRVNGETFDLTSPGDRQRLADRFGEEGIATDLGYGYDPEKNVVLDGDGKVKYDLKNPDDLARFRLDVGDGMLDGVTAHHADAPAYLKEVRVGDKTYDLTTEKGKKDFEKDIADGKLDGKAGKTSGEFKGVSFDPDTRTVTAGDRVYYLDNPKDYHDFRRDAADGKLAGEARQPLFDRGPIRC